MNRSGVFAIIISAGLIGAASLVPAPEAWCEDTPQAYLPEGPVPETVTLTTLTTTTTICNTTTTTIACPTTTTTQPVVHQCPEKPKRYGSLKDGGYYKLEDALKQQYCGPFSCIKDGRTVPCASKTLQQVHLYCIQNPYYNSANDPLLELTVDFGVRGFADSTNGYKGTSGWSKFVAKLKNIGKLNDEYCYICGCFRGGPTGNNGCFAPGMLITMGDKSQKAVEKITAGEFVWNPLLKKAVKVLRVIEGPEPLPLIKVGFGDTTVTVSQEHAMLTAGGLKPAKALNRKDRIYDQDGVLQAVTILEQLPVEEGQRVINLALEFASGDINERMLLGNGIVTGDLSLQEQLMEESR